MRISFLFLASFSLALSLSLSFSETVRAANIPHGYWKFDETTAGATAADSSGNGYNAAPQNTPIPSSSVPPAIQFSDPRSISLDGSQYFILNRPIQDTFTICVWAKTSSVGNGLAHWLTAPFLESEVGGLGMDFGFGIDSDGHLAYGNGGSLSDQVVNGTTLIADNNWHHNCVTRNQSTGEAILYVDGEVDATGTTNIDTLDANPQAQIGAGTDGATTIAGLLDDLRVYDSVLSPDEIAVLASGGELQDLASGDEEERADIASWKAALSKASPHCSQRIKLTIEGKHFDDDARVYIGNKKASSVEVSSRKRLTARFCLADLLKIKTDPKRSVSVKNPDTEKRKADKEIDLTRLPSAAYFNQYTQEGILNIQKMLVLLGFLEKENITGFYGPLTQEAVKKFQLENSIPVTGHVGPLTIAAFLQ